MKVIDVVPLSRGVFRETLSYFTGDDEVAAGMVVSVPVRSRNVLGLVQNVRDVSLSKADIKSSEYSLKKVLKVKGKPFLLPEFMKAAQLSAHFYAGTTGQVLSSMLSKTVVGGNDLASPAVSAKPSGHVARETLVIQASDEERISEYKSLIRERFARGFSVYLCLPTAQEAETLLRFLDRGIQEYSFVLHSSLSAPKLKTAWKEALREKHPVLIIGTGAFLSIPRNDIGTIIIEKESSRFYRANNRPYIDIRVFAEFFAKESKRELILGDSAVRVETFYKVESGEYAEFGSSLKSRALWPGSYKIVDMRANDEGGKKKFEILGKELRGVLEKLSESNEKLFIFTSRRGLSPLTLCGDCGTVVTCKRCSAPTTLHRGGTHTFFLCHHCGEKRASEESCRVCGSWKLETLGIGIEKVEEEIKKLFPKVPLYRLDAETAKTNKKAKDIAKKFYDGPSGVLVGTEISLFYLTEKVENTAVVSIDSLFALPDFRINERIFSMLLAIRAQTSKKFIIQTRNTEATVLGYAASGNLSDFYREEIEIRKEFEYPPFSTLIKITLSGKREAVEKETRQLEKYIEELRPEIFPAFVSTVKGETIINALIKVKRETWPNEEIIAKLKTLPFSYKIQIDPETIL